MNTQSHPGLKDAVLALLDVLGVETDDVVSVILSDRRVAVATIRRDENGVPMFSFDGYLTTTTEYPLGRLPKRSER